MEITVKLGDRSYPIYTGTHTVSTLPEHYGKVFGKRGCAIVTNTTIASLYSDLLGAWKERLQCGSITVPDGEQFKTLDTWRTILDRMFEQQLDRSSVVIALGGGVVGDMAGFAAAAFMRGVDYIQVPTTLLAMVDSSVGGKTAVDHPCGKNLIGAFHQPRMVLIDTSFLDTLTQRQFTAGYAEMFKCAFIGGPAMYAFIRDHHERILQKDRPALIEGIERSVGIKAAIVENDERESSGQRALLNFGHTFAHSLERYFGFEKVLHGEAVFWGIQCAFELALCTGTLKPEAVSPLRQLLANMPLPALPSEPDPEKLYEGMKMDKKTVAGRMRFILPVSEGVSAVVENIDISEVKAAIETVFKR